MKQERLYFVDWLRVLVILTLVPFHSALTYTDIGDIYIKSPIKGISVLPFLIVIAPLDNFFMTLLFFLSGIGTYYAIQYRNEREYRKERAKKLLIPFIFGTILRELSDIIDKLNTSFNRLYFVDNIHCIFYIIVSFVFLTWVDVSPHDFIH